MDSEKIIQDLNRRFAAPLPEFYKRRIVVWIDEDQEFVDKLDEITLGGAKVVALTGTNNFYVKKLLAVDDPTSNYLVYRPFAYESDEDNWLLDIELYGEEFRADLVSMWMDEMGIPQTPALRRGFKQYRKFFNAQARRNKVSAQPVTPTTPAQLQMAIMAALAGLKDAKPNAIIKAVLQAGLLKDSNAVYQEFVNYGIDEAFWRMVAQGIGYQDMDSDLAQLATHILLTASTRTMRQEFLSGLQMFISSAHQAYCYDFVSDWMNSEDAKEKAAHLQEEQDVVYGKIESLIHENAQVAQDQKEYNRRMEALYARCEELKSSMAKVRSQIMDRAGRSRNIEAYLQKISRTEPLTVFDESVFAGTVDCVIVRKGQGTTEKQLIFRFKDGTEVPITIYQCK